MNLVSISSSNYFLNSANFINDMQYGDEMMVSLLAPS